MLAWLLTRRSGEYTRPPVPDVLWNISWSFRHELTRDRRICIPVKGSRVVVKEYYCSMDRRLISANS
jgi:hypothetical protein